MIIALGKQSNLVVIICINERLYTNMSELDKFFVTQRFPCPYGNPTINTTNLRRLLEEKELLD